MGMLLKTLRALWTVLNAARRLVANILFLVLIAAFAAVIWMMRAPELPESTVLLLDLRGDLVHMSTGLWRGRGWASKFVGGTAEETVVADVRDALAAAADDKRVKSVVLRLDRMGAAGPATIQEVGDAVKAFRASGRKVYAWSDTYTQTRWAVASAADEVLMHPMGEVAIKGLEATTLYWGSVLDRFGVTVNVAKAGAYKSAPEVFTETGPSKESVEALRFWLADEWKHLSALMEGYRGLPGGELDRWMESYVQNLKSRGGNAARVAADKNLVDGLVGWRGVEEKVTGKSCAAGKCDGEFTSMEDYLTALDSESESRQSKGGDIVAVITLQGEISDGEVPGSAAGMSADSLVAMVEEAEKDDDVKAVLLQVNSPGGSASASERMREALLAVRKAGKPVVAYLADTAASGGYWVSTAADKIVANPMSVTGSIGVFGIMPTFEKGLSKLGVGVSTERTGALRTSQSPFTELTPEAKEAAALKVEDVYGKFISRVSEARKLAPEAVRAVAEGRVWTGSQALERGLADMTGTFETAVAAAAEAAGLGGEYDVEYFESSVETDVFDMILSRAGVAVFPEWVQGLIARIPDGVGRAAASSGDAGFSVQARALWNLRL